MDNETHIKEIVASIRRLYRAIYLDAGKMSRHFGLTASQSGVLRTLFRREPMSSSELSRALFVTPSNITGIVDRLEKKDVVKRVRDTADRRVIRIRLTEKGRKMSQSLPDPIEKRLIAGLEDLEPEQVKGIRAAVTQLLGLMDAEQVEEKPLE